MYNVLEMLRSGETLSAKEKTIHEQGLVSVLKQIHDDLDAAVAEAYGWPTDLSDEAILERLVALNAVRAAEEQRGLIRYLREDFQRTAAGVAIQTELDLPTASAPAPKLKAKPKQPWPETLVDQAKAVRSALTSAPGPVTPAHPAKTFKRPSLVRITELLETFTLLGQATREGEGFRGS